MQRVCFTLQVRPDRIDEYVARHASVWPDMLAALDAAGWRNYSLFLRPDGLLVGYFETADLDAARAAMDRTDVNRRWQADMAPYFVGLSDGRADHGMTILDEIFNLDDQLDRVRDAAAPASDQSGDGR